MYCFSFSKDDGVEVQNEYFHVARLITPEPANKKVPEYFMTLDDYTFYYSNIHNYNLHV